MKVNKPIAKVEATQANFPVGPKGKNELKKLLFRSSDPASTITAFQKTHSLHSFLAKAFGTTPIHDCPSMIGKNTKRTTRGMIVSRENDEREGIIPEPLELDSALTFLHHLGVSRYDVHKKVSDELRSQLDNEIERMDLSYKQNQEALEKLLVSTLPFANFSDLSPIIVTLIKKLGDKTPLAVLKSLAVKDSKGGILKHGDLLQQFGLNLKRLVWEADWISSIDSTSPKSGTLYSDHILSDIVLPAVQEYENDDVLKKAADLAFPILSERKYATQHRRAAGGAKGATARKGRTSTGISAFTSGNIHSSTKASADVEDSTTAAPDSTEDTKASSGTALSKLKDIMGKRPTILSAVFNMLIAEHGSPSNNCNNNNNDSNDATDVNDTILGGSSYLRCTLVADIILSYGHLPRQYENVHSLASVLDKCVKDGHVSDQSLVQIQSSLKVIFSPSKEKDNSTPTNLETNTAPPSTSKDATSKTKVASPHTTTKTPVKSAEKDDDQFERKLLRKVITNVVKDMKESDPQSLFLNPVTDEIAAGYSRVIKKPMCIRVIESKASNLEYATMSEYKSDVLLMFQNCITYNIGENGSWFRGEAKRQQRVWKTEICKKAESFHQTEMSKRKKALLKAASPPVAASAEMNEKKRKHEVLLAQKKHLSKVAGKATGDNKGTRQIAGNDKNTMNQILHIEPLPESRNKRRRKDKDSEFPSMPALASMLLSDPFVVRLFLDKLLRGMRSEVKEKKIPASYGTIPSVLQLLHLSQFSTQLAQIRGKRFGIPRSGLSAPSVDKNEEEIDLLSQLPFLTLRKFSPLLSKLLLDIDLDSRVSVGGDLYDVASEISSLRPSMDGNEWEDSSSCILKAAVEGALIHLMQPGNSTESALQTQFPRITVAIDKLSGENMLNERPFYMSLIQALLRHKSKLSHGMRDMVVNKWLSWFKSKSGGSCMTSSVHECFLILLDEWSSLGNTLLPRETCLTFAEDAVKESMETEINGSTFAQVWNERQSFAKIKIHYEKMLQNVPEARATKWRVSVGIDSEEST